MTQITSTRVIKYNLAARIFHWIGALLIVLAWFLAQQGEDYLSLHKSIGVSFLIWTMLRIANRVFTKDPTPLPVSKIYTVIANVVHLALYVAMIVMPLTAFLASMYGGHGVNVFGIISISGFKIPNTELADRLIDWHTDIVWPMLLVFVAAHIIGALYHQFILKDHILSRMR
ncbi:cytochrome b [Moraxella catarrhalis]|uniref:cytochrome b n=1 Tax=Moraxella catarrhalis TaxID=480 RepID=UPI000312C91D|nr:cytochrome b/b6 domain-containing protein [Moraxella catarrhalis]